MATGARIRLLCGGMTTRLFHAVLVAYLCVVCGLSSAFGQGEVREWKSSSGKTLRAALVQDQGDTIQLRLPDGKVGTVKTATLSADDQTYLASLRRPVTDVVVLYRTELQLAESIQELAEGAGLKTRLRKVDVPGDDMKLGGGRVVVLTHDTAEWGDPDSGALLVRELRRSQRPVVAMGLAASRLFPRLELGLGRSPVEFTGDSVAIHQADAPVFAGLTDAPVTAQQTLQLYGKYNSVYGVNVDPIPPYIKPLAMVVESRQNYMGLAIEDERYALWGFAGSAQIMTETGRKLFVALLRQLLTVAPVVAEEEPEPPAPQPEPEPESPPQAPAQPEEETPPPAQEVERPVTRMSPPGTVINPASKIVTKVHAPGQEPSYPGKTVSKFQLYPTSKDARAVSMFFDFEAALHIVGEDVTVSKAGGSYYQYKQESGNIRYSPLVKIMARNRDIPEKSVLVIEYFSRDIGGSERTRAAVQHVALPAIKRGSHVTAEASGLSLYKSETKSNYSYESSSGSEVFGLVLSLYDPQQNLLFQEATHQSLRELASPNLLPATL
jgi:hypothetical protein